MNFVNRLHDQRVHNRRVRVLSEQLAELIPQGARVIDIGCGDGLLAHLIKQKRPDIRIRGVDLLVRNQTHIPVEAFDGRLIPYADASFDVVTFVDVLHHTEDPMALLREAVRVSSKAIVIKDHICNGLLAGPTLRFMDWVGNAHHGVTLPYNYWPQWKWLEAFDTLGLTIEFWKKDLSLYPWPAGWVFGRSLHFAARLNLEAKPRKSSKPMFDAPLPGEGSKPDMVRIAQPDACCADAWEAAYLRFETPEQEIRKFTRRLVEVGAVRWPRDAEIVELFCGRGNGLNALSKLGFTRLAGVDLSASLLAQYTGPGKVYVSDCRKLPFDDRSKDIVIIQGGLHHLLTLPNDLEQTLSQGNRVLKNDGLFVVVEPWLTPFLSFVHAICRNSIAKRLSRKVDALATMIHYEQQTYEQWLTQSGAIINLLQKYFNADRCSFAWGKLIFVGRRKDGVHK